MKMNNKKEYYLIIEDRNTGSIIGKDYVGLCTKGEAEHYLSYVLVGCYDRHTEKVYLTS
jgi:hypothetical protein